MSKAMPYLMIAAALLLTLAHGSAMAVEAWQLKETRYCGAPERYADGTIKRSRAVLMAFARLHPCPSNGLPDIGCPGWAIDHVIPLKVGGCDSVSNAQWLNDQIKSCAGDFCKDRFERHIYVYPLEHLVPLSRDLAPPLMAPPGP